MKLLFLLALYICYGHVWVQLWESVIRLTIGIFAEYSLKQYRVELPGVPNGRRLSSVFWSLGADNVFRPKGSISTYHWYHIIRNPIPFPRLFLVLSIRKLLSLISRVSPARKSYDTWFFDQACWVKMDRYWPGLGFLYTSTSFWSIKIKKELAFWPISIHLTSRLINNAYIPSVQSIFINYQHVTDKFRRKFSIDHRRTSYSTIRLFQK